jgi:hypothetical protein
VGIPCETLHSRGAESIGTGHKWWDGICRMEGLSSEVSRAGIPIGGIQGNPQRPGGMACDDSRVWVRETADNEGSTTSDCPGQQEGLVGPFPRCPDGLFAVRTVLLIADRTDGRSVTTREIGQTMRFGAGDEIVTEDS